MVRGIANDVGLPVSHLYGNGRHWFAPGREVENSDLPPGEGWLEHSLALLKRMAPMAADVAGISLAGGTESEIAALDQAKAFFTFWKHLVIHRNPKKGLSRIKIAAPSRDSLELS